MNVTLDQLRVTLAVAQTSSFSDAARTLHLTQPAVTRAIRTVEGVVGCPLFTRTTRRVELTTEGGEFVAVAARIVREYDDGLRRFDAYQKAERGSLTIAALTSLAEGVLPPIIAAFLAPRPHAEVRLVTGTAPDVMEQLRAGDADIVVSEAVEHGEDVQSAPLGPDPLHAVVPTSHPLSGRSRITWAELSGHDVVALGEGTSVRRLSDSGFLRAGVEPRIAVTADSIGAASALVAQGLGVSAFPESARLLPASTGLEFIELGDPGMKRDLAIITSRAPAPSALARAFVEVAVTAAGARVADSVAP
ncbi:LysR family transcriptional regulator [Microbacterium sp.]|uniref:LysR family transcriptional regulator n=2 Tax=Microbacterium sp. TaxID=51671 RepID=UPI000925D18A|nr:LysR family transcriptional regulator [Microbacterium sp.]MBN9193872.1 LysR family transcriptional regulator [Microbacterium sp.]OJU70096.1 MAG: hypothetical protein BGO04_05255 [Microbacterium sp. 70-38]